ncbi:MAG: glycosyltransferase [Caulobacteraceae bacterium]
MNLVFVNYGSFGNNSGYHIEGFALRLSRKGHNVALIADGAPERLLPGVFLATFDQVRHATAPAEALEMLRDRETIIHGWTPRDTVREFVRPFALNGLRYVVHLEDNETLILANRLKVNQSSIRIKTDNLNSHDDGDPTLNFRRFLNGAAGVSVIIDSLKRDVPAGKPMLLLEPGVDSATFCKHLTPNARAAIRSSLGYTPDTTLIVYAGNVHEAIQQDMFSLYTAVGNLNTRGYDIKLLRTGTPENLTRTSSAYKRATGVQHLGWVDRDRLPELMDLADIFIQPGWLNPFNAYRLPSKLPEFLSMGRPVVLPKSNLGWKLTNGENAVVLDMGGAGPIMEAVLMLRQSPALSKAIGEGGRDFALRHFNWDEKVIALEQFYSAVLNAPALT